jgi:hypothetical protein
LEKKFGKTEKKNIYRASWHAVDWLSWIQFKCIIPMELSKECEIQSIRRTSFLKQKEKFPKKI